MMGEEIRQGFTIILNLTSHDLILDIMQNSLNCNLYIFHINIVHWKHIWNTSLLKDAKFIWHLFIHRFVLHPLTHLFVLLLHDLFILFHASFLLTYESIIKICHYVFHKKCHDNFLESCVAICLRSLFSSFWHFWVCVDEVFCPPNTSIALCLCMV